MEDDLPMLKTAKGALTGLAAGTIWGTIMASWYDVPRVQRHVALPGLVRTLKMCGSYGVTFAAVGVLYIGVEKIVESQRKKRDFVNGAVPSSAAPPSIATEVRRVSLQYPVYVHTSWFVDSGHKCTLRLANNR
jgi:hypothetical protein